MNDLKLSLIVEALDRATAPLRRVGEALDHVKEHTERLHHAMHKLGMAEFIGGAFFTGFAVEAGHMIFELTDKVAELGESALRSSEKTGASVEAMQRWSWAANQMGVEAESVSTAFGMMEFHVSNALTGNKESIGALKLLGISLKEIRQLSNDPSGMFARMVKGFEGIKSPVAQARVGRDLFGRQWMELAPLLKAKPEEVNGLMEQLKKAHAVISKEDAEASKKFEQAKGNMGLAVEGLGMRIGHTLIPKLTQVIDKLTTWLEGLKDKSIEHFTDAIGKLADKLVDMLPKFEDAVKGLLKLTNGFLDLTNNTFAFKTAVGVLTTFLAAQAAIAFANTAVSIGRIGLAALRAIPMILGLIPTLGSLTATMAGLDAAMDANPIGLITLGIAALIGVIALVVMNWDTLVKSVQDGCDRLSKAFKSLDDSLPPWLRQALKGGEGLLAFQFPEMGILGLGVGALGKGSHQQPAGSGPRARFSPASYEGPGRSRSDVLGTIFVKTDGGLSVSRLKASAGVDFVHDRGSLPM